MENKELLVYILIIGYGLLSYSIGLFMGYLWGKTRR